MNRRVDKEFVKDYLNQLSNDENPISKEDLEILSEHNIEIIKIKKEKKKDNDISKSKDRSKERR